MIKNFSVVLTLILLVAVGCTPKKDYADVKKFFNDVIKYQEGQIASLEKAKTGKDVAAALTKNKDMLTDMMKKGKEFDAKYPELKNSKEPPVELKPLYTKVEEISKKYIQVTMDIMKKYEKDPDVQKALKP